MLRHGLPRLDGPRGGPVAVVLAALDRRDDGVDYVLLRAILSSLADFDSGFGHILV